MISVMQRPSLSLSTTISSKSTPTTTLSNPTKDEQQRSYSQPVVLQSPVQSWQRQEWTLTTASKSNDIKLSPAQHRPPTSVSSSPASIAKSSSPSRDGSDPKRTPNMMATLHPSAPYGGPHSSSPVALQAPHFHPYQSHHIDTLRGAVVSGPGEPNTLHGWSSDMSSAGKGMLYHNHAHASTSSASPSTSRGPPAANLTLGGQKKRLQSCDVCRIRKVRCIRLEDGMGGYLQKCKQCDQNDAKCTYIYVPKKPGPQTSSAKAAAAAAAAARRRGVTMDVSSSTSTNASGLYGFPNVNVPSFPANDALASSATPQGMQGASWGYMAPAAAGLPTGQQGFVEGGRLFTQSMIAQSVSQGPISPALPQDALNARSYSMSSVSASQSAPGVLEQSLHGHPNSAVEAREGMMHALTASPFAMTNDLQSHPNGSMSRSSSPHSSAVMFGSSLTPTQPAELANAQATASFPSTPAQYSPYSNQVLAQSFQPTSSAQSSCSNASDFSSAFSASSVAAAVPSTPARADDMGLGPGMGLGLAGMAAMDGQSLVYTQQPLHSAPASVTNFDTSMTPTTAVWPPRNASMSLASAGYMDPAQQAQRQAAAPAEHDGVAFPAAGAFTAAFDWQAQQPFASSTAQTLFSSDVTNAAQWPDAWPAHHP